MRVNGGGLRGGTVGGDGAVDAGSGFGSGSGIGGMTSARVGRRAFEDPPTPTTPDSGPIDDPRVVLERIDGGCGIALRARGRSVRDLRRGAAVETRAVPRDRSGERERPNRRRDRRLGRYG